MRGKQRKTMLTRAWGSNFALKNGPVKRWPATIKRCVSRVFSNTGPNSEDRLRRLFLGALVRVDLLISNRAPVRLTHEREWQ